MGEERKEESDGPGGPLRPGLCPVPPKPRPGAREGAVSLWKLGLGQDLEVFGPHKGLAGPGSSAQSYLSTA